MGVSTLGAFGAFSICKHSYYRYVYIKASRIYVEISKKIGLLILL